MESDWTALRIHEVPQKILLLFSPQEFQYGTVKTGIIGPHARTLELPLLVRSGPFFILFFIAYANAEESVLAVFLPPYPGIFDVLA